MTEISEQTLEEEAENGDPYAMHHLAARYFDKIQDTNYYPEECAYWAKSALENSDDVMRPNAMWLMYLLYRNGIGVEKNEKKAWEYIDEIIKIVPGLKEEVSKLAENHKGSSSSYKSSVDLLVSLRVGSPPQLSKPTEEI